MRLGREILFDGGSVVHAPPAFTANDCKKYAEPIPGGASPSPPRTSSPLGHIFGGAESVDKLSRVATTATTVAAKESGGATVDCDIRDASANTNTNTDTNANAKTNNHNAHNTFNTNNTYNTCNAQHAKGNNNDKAQASHSIIGTIHDINATTDLTATELIAREMSNMSINDQQRVYQDVHGMSRPNEETSSFLIAKLDDMDIHINMIPNKLAYNLALQQSPAYVHDAKLRIMFLRTEHFNPKMAAERFVGWFEIKLQTFGKDVLVKRITMDDLSDEAKDLICSGKVQLCPRRDHAGRPIMCSLNFDAELFSTPAPVEVFFYFGMAMVDDEENQRTGFVCIHTTTNLSVGMDAQQLLNYLRCAQNLNFLPVRFQCLHLVGEFNNTLLRIIDKLQLAFPMEVRHRCRVHYGSLQQCKYALMCYGIPVSSMPVTDDGKITMTHHLKWLDHRRTLEASIHMQNISAQLLQAAAIQQISTAHIASSSQSSQVKPGDDVSVSDGSVNASGSATESIASQGSSHSVQQDQAAEEPQKEPQNCITEITEHDILLGRGRPFQSHSGNERLRRSICEWFDRYEASPRRTKKVVSEHIVNEIHKVGGRFLKKVQRGKAKDDGAWYEVDFVEARDKVSHGFRKKREMDGIKKARAKPVATTATDVTQVNHAKRQRIEQFAGCS